MTNLARTDAGDVHGPGSSGRRLIEKLAGARSRRHKPRPFSRRELAIASICGVNLTVSPWLTSGQSLGAQLISAVLSLGAFAFLFLPVGPDESRSKSAAESLSALVRCVPFWTGGALLTLFCIQGLNPAYSVAFDGGEWVLIPEKHLTWLPSGIAAPFERSAVPGGMNAFRQALMLLSPWLTFCTLWCGLRSRRLRSALLTYVVISYGALALAGIAERAGDGGFGLATASAPGASVFGSFSYQNQAGAFFALVALIAFSVGLKSWSRAVESGRTSGAYQALFATWLLCEAAAVATFSFGAMVSAVIAVPVLFVASRICRARLDEAFEGRGRFSSSQFVVIMIMCVALLASLFTFADFRGAIRKIEEKITRISHNTLDDRGPIHEATWKMYTDHSLAWGVGAGSYRWASPAYFEKMPEFQDAEGRLNRRASHAHGDWFQILAEWGLAGLTLVVATVVYLAWSVRSVRLREHAAAWPVCAGLAILAVHACVDCLLFNPSVSGLVVLAFVFIRTETDRRTS